MADPRALCHRERMWRTPALGKCISKKGGGDRRQYHSPHQPPDSSEHSALQEWDYQGPQGLTIRAGGLAPECRCESERRRLAVSAEC